MGQTYTKRCWAVCLKSKVDWISCMFICCPLTLREQQNFFTSYCVRRADRCQSPCSGGLGSHGQLSASRLPLSPGSVHSLTLAMVPHADPTVRFSSLLSFPLLTPWGTTNGHEVAEGPPTPPTDDNDSGYWRPFHWCRASRLCFPPCRNPPCTRL
jgi:hypothetical protein